MKGGFIAVRAARDTLRDVALRRISTLRDNVLTTSRPYDKLQEMATITIESPDMTDTAQGCAVLLIGYLSFVLTCTVNVKLPSSQVIKRS